MTNNYYINKMLFTCALFFSFMLVNSLVYALPGDEKWFAPTGGNIGSSAAINPVSGDIYVGAANFYVLSFDSLGNLKWRFLTGGYVSSGPFDSLFF